MANALQHCASVLADDGDEELESQTSLDKVTEFGSFLKDALQDVWEDDAGDVFDAGCAHSHAYHLISASFEYSGSQDDAARMHRLSEEIGTIQTFRNSFSPILNAVLKALEAPPVFMRTKALKALGQIVTSDPSILSLVSDIDSHHEYHHLSAGYSRTCGGRLRHIYWTAHLQYEMLRWNLSASI